MLLAGDVGGTKTVLAVFSPEHGAQHPIAEARFLSGEHSSLPAIVAEFLADVDVEISRASFGVAGPVVAGEATVTNLPWVLTECDLSAALQGVPVRLINDLEAIASYVPFAPAADRYTLNAGSPVENGPLAVIAPGTGLGEAYLVWDGRTYRTQASEGGHVDFAPTTPMQIELLRYLQQRFGHVSYERVCSGRGIPNLYAYFRDNRLYDEPAWLRAELAAAADRAPIIVRAAVERYAEICTATLDLFIAILGSAAGNLALKFMATGGVFLGGGIPPRILPQLNTGAFMEAFTRKGRFADLLVHVPVHVIRNAKAALYGAAHYGLTQALT